MKWKTSSITLAKYLKFLKQKVKWCNSSFWKTNWHGVFHFNTLLSWPSSFTQNVLLLPAPPLNPTVHSEPWCNLPRLSPARSFCGSSHPYTSVTPLPSRQYSSQKNFNFFSKSYGCLFVFYFGTMGRNCQAHLLKSEVLAVGGSTRGSFVPISVFIRV